MTRQSIAIAFSLIRQFRNAPKLIGCRWSGRPCDFAVTWTGKTLIHPAGVSGFLDVLLEHWVSRVYLRDNFYTPVPGDVVLDIGAHIGLFSIQLVRLCEQLKILAFEPAKSSFQCLEANLESFGCRNVKTFRMALGAARGRGEMRSGKRTLDNAVEVANSEAGSFPIVPLIEILEFAKTDRIALMKVDIEGSEKEAFRGSNPDLLRRIDRIILEYHDNVIPGCLEAVCESLRETHEIQVSPSPLGCGVIRATCRSVPQAEKIAEHGPDNY